MTVTLRSRTSALASLLLALPFAVLLTLLTLQIQPNLGPLDALIAALGSRLGSYIVFAAFFLTLAAFAVAFTPVARALRDGQAASPILLLLAAATLFLIAYFLGAIIIDQFLCWIGVPNCD